MKLLLALFLVGGSYVCASEALEDFEFNQDRMFVSDEHVYTVSTFLDCDYLCVHDHFGNLVWKAPFHAKILSWQVRGQLVFVFSKARDGERTYLTCLNGFTGKVHWQKP
jgi:hypothetical protein